MWSDNDPNDPRNQDNDIHYCPEKCGNEEQLEWDNRGFFYCECGYEFYPYDL